MEVTFTVAIRNPLWFWPKEEMKKEKDYRKTWEAINADKIDKHNPFWQYKIPFDVEEIKENRETEHQIKLASAKDNNGSIYFTLKDVSVVTFISKTEKMEAVISNSLIHQYLGAKQQEYINYVYFYLTENCRYYHPVDQLIWMSESAKKEMDRYISNGG